jgi:DNA helicase-2/ATP-dependent DNA helicase PcrA
VEQIDIQICGRCAAPILDLANELISHAPARSKPALVARAETAGKVSVVQWADVHEEVEGLTAAIAAAVDQRQREAGDVLVLVHRQQIGEMLRRRLVELGVPAHSFFSQESVRSDEARRGLALLRLAVGDDPASLRVICGVGDAKARAPAYQRLSRYCHEQGKSTRDALDELVSGATLPIRIPAIVEQYRSAAVTLAALEGEDLLSVVEQLFPPALPEVADVREIALEEAREAQDIGDLADRVVTRVTQHDVPETPDYVRIMSLHKSKGLTSPVVYLASVIDGIIPTIPPRLDEAQADAARDEQRRLVYVAITRAAEELVISSVLQMDVALASSLSVRVVRDRIRSVDGRVVAPTIASPYLDEMSATAPTAQRGLAWLRELVS